MTVSCLLRREQSRPDRQPTLKTRLTRPPPLLLEAVGRYLPPPLHPPYDLSPTFDSICRIQQPLPRSLEPTPLLYQTPEHLPALRDQYVQLVLRLVRKRLLPQRMRVAVRGAVVGLIRPGVVRPEGEGRFVGW